MTSLVDDEPDWVMKAIFYADDHFDDEDQPLEWWLTMAAESARLGVDKQAFMKWVDAHYAYDENRFMASTAWDIYKLGESE